MQVGKLARGARPAVRKDRATPQLWRPDGKHAMRRAGQAISKVETSIVFQPFKEVQPILKEVDAIEKDVNRSFARTDYEEFLEAAVNEQINVEYNISYVYHSVSAFFDRDNIGLPGFAAYFREQSKDEREHAQLLMEHQTRRGGRVKLASILAPEVEYQHEEKGEALHAMEISLSLEKLNFQKLRSLHDVAQRAEDAEFQNFIESYLLYNQVKEIKEVSDKVSQLRRVGKGLGVYYIDRELSEELEGEAAAA